jgi:uncharacterized protein YdhG (YjbR/CyaY superfamily)
MKTDPIIEFNNIDEYIASQPDHIKEPLEQLRQVIKEAAPDSEETISYQMPAFRFHGILCYFASFKNHYSLFISPDILLNFKDKLTSYELSRGTMRIPIQEPVPEKIISEMVKYAAREKIKKAQFRKAKKKKD